MTATGTEISQSSKKFRARYNLEPCSIWMARDVLPGKQLRPIRWSDPSYMSGESQLSDYHIYASAATDFPNHRKAVWSAPGIANFHTKMGSKNLLPMTTKVEFG